MLLCNNDDEEDIVLDESDAEDEEHISDREDDSDYRVALRDISDVWKCLFTDRITKIIVEENNKYICSMKPNYSRSRDVRDTDGAEIEGLSALLYLAGVYHKNRVNLVDLWRMD
ncbi:hypothetical protein NPIL_153171 [Nephila pilipes]|uniref:PiggyBac transposable element-derived protein domain-containing protein n=1 Tax=Nephila pilipes TaxID=299642 RepID=A0A8X6MGL0_NEPPI|nr:hypothetical protein NPIL_153171 [Nephila pilipes]